MDKNVPFHTSVDVNSHARHHSGVNLLALLARVILGGALLVAGGLKALHPYQAAAAVRAYELLPVSVANPVGYALPWIEIGVGFILILGLYIRLGALLGAGMMLIFIIGVGSAWARGLSIDCGCFGGGGAVDPSKTAYASEIARDLLFFACGAFLLWRPGTRWSLDSWGSGRIMADPYEDESENDEKES
ncbi:MAG: DoxX family membrane protein [Actinobacteria bacterium]|uniref:Unannotated protein n=1 Tax=freshwater metagenome TaxID=449393 RepID=A0A6J7SNR4_9ZZZZ|nr:DoxX family membrane protein [Actinomycetota bacterium]MSZ87552.1 DoxX family membrane protein [Actinomycetota bacterium]MTB13593.1 DoxX family membrane protein [Actinomycetota bacterium]MTB25941.1 DoxX family membrane protein [Actinomycetota bacterium]